jgi:hypothetical protein
MEEKVDWLEKAIEYEATPKALREPKEKGEFIKSLGIPESTYRYNVSKKENKRRIVEIWLNEALNGGNEILAKLAEKAKGGDMKAIELYIKFVLELAENLDIKSDGKALNTLLVEFINGKENNTNANTGGIPEAIR